MLALVGSTATFYVKSDHEMAMPKMVRTATKVPICAGPWYQ